MAAASGASRSAFSSFMNGPTGPRTVHFWAPVMKWGLVIAGASDFARPAEQLSLSQNAALVATGTIWTRWSMIIKPRNIMLASVNCLLATVGSIQLARIFMSRQEEAKKPAVIQALEDVKK